MKNDNKISLNEIKELVTNIFLKQGCNQENASALANTITKAEEDGSSSHGLFRLPGYVASLKSGKVNGHASPKVINKTPVILKCDADNGFASTSHEVALPLLAESAKKKWNICFKYYRLLPLCSIMARDRIPCKK